MDRPPATTLRIGDWDVNPASGEISHKGETVRVDTRAMRLLLCLAERAGQTVSIDELLDQAWPEVIVTPDSVYQAVASLRRLLGDDPKQPSYIATVPRLGYRMVAPVSHGTGQPLAATVRQVAPVTSSADDTSAKPRRRRFAWLTASGAAVSLALFVGALLHEMDANKNRPALTSEVDRPQISVAVLPFLDLTEQMSEEPFADGMTEELIGRLSKVRGFRVPAPTSSFYFKGKRLPIGDIAKALGVSYILDGSVRKSGTTVRVAARLIRADDAFVVWSETYDRRFDDILKVQDSIASEVASALRNIR